MKKKILFLRFDINVLTLLLDCLQKQIYRHYLFIESNCQAQLSSAFFGLLQVVHSLSLCARNFIGLTL